MSENEGTMEIGRYGAPAPVTRTIGWATLGALAAFLINNVLNVGFNVSAPGAVLAGDMSGLVSAVVYLLAIGLGISYVARSPDTALRWDAERIHRVNIYLIRGVYFAVFFIGIVDVSIAFMRVEHIIDLFGDQALVRDFERPAFLGLYVHLPLVVLGFVVAAFSTSLGFMWLSLLIILAELSIVITRFVFSYEQAFMGDLVRYWYSGLFLLASAYTLHEEGHVRVDVIYSNLSARTKGMMNVIGTLLLGMPTAWMILAVGFAGKQSIINSPVMNFEITQTGGIGMYVKYQMAAFLGIFGATMLIQFVSMLFSSVADFRGEAGHHEFDAATQ